jgi:hypothetical protein
MTLSMAPVVCGFGVLLLAGLVGAQGGQPTQNPPARSADQGETLTVRNQFDTVLTYRTAAGETRRVHVGRRQWSLTGQVTVPRSKEPGLLIVQLGGGEVTITLGQERRKPRSDEFWTVPPRAPFRIDVGREQATLEVLAVNGQ